MTATTAYQQATPAVLGISWPRWMKPLVRVVLEQAKSG